MSRGFVKEEDQEEIPMVPPRADLPIGAINYVTQKGLNKLLQERIKSQLEKHEIFQDNEKDRRIATNLINAKLRLLNERISSAKVVNLSEQPSHEVRFGATVSMLIGTSKTPQKFQIVGVDEANISENKISFLSPIARILISKKVKEIATLQLGKVDRNFKIVDISYHD